MSIRGAKQDFKPGQKANRFDKRVVSPAKDPRQPAAPVTDAAASLLFPVIGVVSRRRKA
jgi:hypothetical protein